MILAKVCYSKLKHQLDLRTPQNSVDLPLMVTLEVQVESYDILICSKFRVYNSQLRNRLSKNWHPSQQPYILGDSGLNNLISSTFNFLFSVPKLQVIDQLVKDIHLSHMLSPIKDLKTMHKSMSSKTVLIQNHPSLRQAIKTYFLQTYALYEQLFQIIADHEAYYFRAEPLRHPLIFYYGHTAAVYINKCFDYGIITERINPDYEKMFAVGVDQMDWDDLNESHYEWPSVPDTTKFREKVKDLILEVINRSTIDKIQNWHSDMWVLLMGIEHERIHLETSAVIMRRVPIEYIKPVEAFVECPARQENLKKIPENKMVEVSAWKATWQRKTQQPQTYGWDNEFGTKNFDVKGFRASQMLVSNGEYLKFILDGGYNKLEYWTEQGRRWLASIRPSEPLFWRRKGDQYQLRTLFNEINMPWDWPVQVNNLQARAFCKWRTAKTGKYTRLPTQDQYYAMRRLLPKDQPTWEYQQVGNVNMQFWMSPNPVNMFRTADLYDIVGNVWQHTITPIYPLDNFKIHPVYEDFTTPTFDERHDIIKGGSFISTGNEALFHARYAFRRHFYQFAGFRYIESDIEMEVDSHSAQITDANVEMSLKHHYLNNRSYVLEVVSKIKDVLQSVPQHHKALTVGCSVGRIPLELGKYFDQSVGIDYTTRYFQMSTRLRETGFLKFKDIDIDLKKLDVAQKNVALLQMNPENPDEHKVNDCDWVLIDGYSLKKGCLSDVLAKAVRLVTDKAFIAVLSASGVNSISKEEAQEVMSKAASATIEIGQEFRLKASDEDQSYLPVREGQIEFQLSFFKLMK